MISRKYQVFVSSTFKNLEAARKAAIAGVSDCRHIPVALDNFAPQNASDVTVIKREVSDCQIQILILGPTFGEMPAGETRSYTEIEFDLAEEHGQYMMIFPLHWDDVLEQRNRLDSDKDRKELANLDKLEQFYSKATSGKHFFQVWRWNNPEEIRRYVGLRLAALPGEVDAPRGLVPEPSQSELLNSVAQSEFLQSMVEAIKSFDKLYQRTKTNVDAKKRAAEFLAQTYHARMESDETRGIFFESGSSPTFVAEALPQSLWDRVAFGKEGEPSKRISTNNVLVYLLLWLDKGVPCAHFPWGLPEKTYGASYGPIGQLEAREPSFKGTPINQRAREAVASLGSARLALKPDNTSLIITAASGLELTDSHRIRCDDNFALLPQVEAEVRSCFGPHVGSYRNKILKRYLYQTGLPTVLVVDSSKIDCEIDVRKCHFLFDNEVTWGSTLEQHPLAICVGCPTADLGRLLDLAAAALPQFDVVVSETTRPYSALILRNQAFEQRFPEQVSLLPNSGH